jgi:hypothetical protein
MLFQGVASFYSVIFVMRGSCLLLLPAKKKRRTLATFAAIRLTIFIMRRASNVLTTSDALDECVSIHPVAAHLIANRRKRQTISKRVSDNHHYVRPF